MALEASLTLIVIVVFQDEQSPIYKVHMQDGLTFLLLAASDSDRWDGVGGS